MYESCKSKAMKKVLFLAIFFAPFAASAWTFSVTPSPIPSADAPVTITFSDGNADGSEHVYAFEPQPNQGCLLIDSGVADGNCGFTNTQNAILPLNSWIYNNTPQTGMWHFVGVQGATGGAQGVDEETCNTGTYSACIASAGHTGLQDIAISYGATTGGWFVPDMSNTAAALGGAVTSTTGSIWPIILIFLGVPFAFYVIAKILEMMRKQDDEDKKLYARADATMRETEKLLRNRRET